MKKSLQNKVNVIAVILMAQREIQIIAMQLALEIRMRYAEEEMQILYIKYLI